VRRHRGAIGRAVGVLTLSLLALASPLRAADEPAAKSKAKPQLEIKVEGIEGAPRTAVADSLDLSLFVKRKDLTAGRLRRMVAAAPRQAQRALEVYGYYEAKARAKSVKRDGGWTVTVKVERGRRTTIVAAEASVDGPARDERAVQFALEAVRRLKDDPFEHVRYEDAKRRVERALLRLGYFDFELDTHRVDVRRADATARVTLAWTSGERFRFGELRFEGAQFPDTFMARYVEFAPGDPFDQERLEDLQRQLAGSDYFDQITVQASRDDAVNDTVPVVVTLSPSKRTVYRIGASIDTDYGAGVRFGIERRYVNSRGHRLSSDVRLDQRLEAVALEYQIPRLNGPESVWGLGLLYRDEHTDVVDSRSYIALGSIANRWHDWRVVGSINVLHSDYLVGRRPRDVPTDDRINTVVTYPELRADRVFARDRIRPRRGASLGLRARIAGEGVASDVSLLQFYATAKWVRSLGKVGRLLARGELGTTVTDELETIPPELRFFAGGINSVRGYEFQSVGTTDQFGEPTGGKHLVTASIEYERLFRPEFAWAAFADAGDAWSNGAPEPVLGVGVGLRWLSPVGPVRVDIAHGLDNDDRRIELHVSAGPDL
jgi:translocation and assembly module TamA